MKARTSIPVFLLAETDTVAERINDFHDIAPGQFFNARIEEAIFFADQFLLYSD